MTRQDKIDAAQKRLAEAHDAVSAACRELAEACVSDDDPTPEELAQKERERILELRAQNGHPNPMDNEYIGAGSNSDDGHYDKNGYWWGLC